MAESTLLFTSLVLLFLVFQYYNRELEKREAEKKILNTQLKNKEKELLNALEYLGRVNVQVSMIKDLYGKMEIPSTKNRLKNILGEILAIIVNVTKEERAVLRIVNLKTGKTIREDFVGNQDKGEDFELLKNNELIAIFEGKKPKKKRCCQIFYSEADNFFAKAFVLVSDKKKSATGNAEKEFLQAIANQCEIIFLLFTSRYYNYKKEKK